MDGNITGFHKWTIRPSEQEWLFIFYTSTFFSVPGGIYTHFNPSTSKLLCLPVMLQVCNITGLHIWTVLMAEWLRRGSSEHPSLGSRPSEVERQEWGRGGWRQGGREKGRRYKIFVSVPKKPHKICLQCLARFP